MGAGSVGGCAAIPLATLAAAGSAVQSGASVWKSGRLSSAKWATYIDSIRATERAVRDLSLGVRYTTHNDEVTVFYLRDERGKKMSIEVVRRSDTFTTIQVNMGFFGSQAMARTILARIEDHLVPAGSLDPADVRSIGGLTPSPTDQG